MHCFEASLASGFKMDARITTMSEHERDTTGDCLSSRQGMTLRNIKFFRGTNEVISKDAFRDELCASVARRDSGVLVSAGQPPRCRKEPVDVRAWVANM